MDFHKTFFCTQCGTKLKGKSKKCHQCGFDFQAENPYGNKTALGAGGIGWSDKINDPLFSKYQSNHRKYIFFFALILIFAIPLLLISIGDLRLDREGAIVTTVISAMFFGIAFFSILKTKTQSREWEGIVVDKKDWTQENKQINRNVLFVQLNNHKIKEISFDDNSTQYGYYQIDDRLKNHQKKNLRALEKFDKSKDVILFCPSCGYMCDTRDNYCQACGSPLLKGTYNKLKS